MAGAADFSCSFHDLVQNRDLDQRRILLGQRLRPGRFVPTGLSLNFRIASTAARRTLTLES